MGASDTNIVGSLSSLSRSLWNHRRIGHVRRKRVTIRISGGKVVGVSGLPEGYNFDIVYLDPEFHVGPKDKSPIERIREYEDSLEGPRLAVEDQLSGSVSQLGK